ncbi:MAG: hypothetical protein ACTHWZ_00100 [Peptoniphilaceae bacterium]
MKNLNNRLLIILISISTLLTIFILSISYMNINKSYDELKNLKNQNLKLNFKIKEKQNKINIINSSINSKKRKINKLLDFDKKFLNTNEKLKENRENSIYDLYLISEISPSFDLIKSGKNLRNTSKLDNVYFEEDLNFQSSATNIKINNLLVLDKISYEINEYIYKNNNFIKQNKGIYEYLNSTNNYLLKYEISKFLSNKDKNYKIKEIEESARNLIMLKEKYKDFYYPFLNKNQKNKDYIQSLSNIITLEKSKINLNDYKIDKKNVENYKKIINAYVFNLEVISKNIDNTENFSILNKDVIIGDKKENLKYMISDDNTIKIIEKKENEAKKLYFYNTNEEVVFYINLDELKSIYFNIDKGEEVEKELKNSKNLINLVKGKNY